MQAACGHPPSRKSDRSPNPCRDQKPDSRNRDKGMPLRRPALVSEEPRPFRMRSNVAFCAVGAMTLTLFPDQLINTCVLQNSPHLPPGAHASSISAPPGLPQAASQSGPSAPCRRFPLPFLPGSGRHAPICGPRRQGRKPGLPRFAARHPRRPRPQDLPQNCKFCSNKLPV